MALSLEDKLLGEKVNNYCSSSEDESDVQIKPEPEGPVRLEHKGYATNVSEFEFP